MVSPSTTSAGAPACAAGASRPASSRSRSKRLAADVLAARARVLAGGGDRRVERGCASLLTNRSRPSFEREPFPAQHPARGLVLAQGRRVDGFRRASPVDRAPRAGDRVLVAAPSRGAPGRRGTTRRSTASHRGRRAGPGARGGRATREGDAGRGGAEKGAGSNARGGGGGERHREVGRRGGSSRAGRCGGSWPRASARPSVLTRRNPRHGPLARRSWESSRGRSKDDGSISRANLRRK